jgi:hypothetical protein
MSTGLSEASVSGRVAHPAVADEHYVILSTDHAVASLLAYRDYLPSKRHDEFDEWVKRFENPFANPQASTAYRNWDSARRLRQLGEDGVMAEVLYPNTIPLFLSRAFLPKGDQ